MPELEGTTLSHYHLHFALGRGGMSEVYLATDQHSQQEVALKVVNSSHLEYSERFQREVKTMSALTHPHILPALDHGQEGPWYYLVMPYIKQGTLRGRLAKGPLTLEEAGEVLEQVADALQFAHDHGIMHRDIKPSNILLQDEHYVYLADFGVAKAIWAEDEDEITQTGSVLGTPEYMAPELVERPTSTSSDMYALGILLYEMLTGRTPFKGSTPLATCWKQLREQPTRPSTLNPAVSLAVERVVLCALEKDPRRRFPSARALFQAYTRSLRVVEPSEALLAQLETSPQQDTAPLQVVPRQSISRALSSRKLVAIPVLLLLLLTCSLSLGFFAVSNHAQQAPAARSVSASLLGVKDMHTPPPQSSPGVNASNNGDNDGRDGNGDGHDGGGHGHGHGDGNPTD